jgi:hypothetical protein
MLLGGGVDSGGDPGPGDAAAGQFFDAIPDPTDRSKIASGNAEALFHLTW